MRLIDADAIVYTHEVARSLDDRHNWIELCVTQDDIADMPTIDAVEVVRCKDCKYFELNHWDGPIITAHEICSKWGNGCKTDRNGYCFMGERKTDV